MSLLLLIAASVDFATVDLPRSTLAPGETTHDWAVIFRENEEVQLLDKVMMPDYRDETGTYPVVLTRGIEANLDRSVYFIDAAIAIDCEKSMLAVVDVSEPTPQNGKPKLGLFDYGKFIQANDRADEQPLTAMFQQACGPEWKFKAR